MVFKDTVRVLDRGIVQLRNKLGSLIAGREWADPDFDKPVVQVEGWVNIVCRERGKIVSRREGKNIWTNTGREYLAMLMSNEVAGSPGTAFRDDRIAYVGVGTGSQVEEAGVVGLVTPAAYATGLFLAALDVPPTFPLTPTRTTVKYRRLFSESDINLTPGSTVMVSEIGLFTNGRQADYVAGSRDLTLTNAASQSPVAYKSFEPIGKKDTLQLELYWEIRF